MCELLVLIKKGRGGGRDYNFHVSEGAAVLMHWHVMNLLALRDNCQRGLLRLDGMVCCRGISLLVA